MCSNSSCMLLISTHKPLGDSEVLIGFNSIKTGSSVTPDPIKLLAAVCHRDMNNNATKLEGWKHEDVNRQGPNGNTRQRGAIQKQQDAALSAAAE